MLDKIYAVIVILAVSFIAFIYGAAITRFEVFPYTWLKDAFVAAEALLIQRTGQEGQLWHVGAKPSIPEDVASPPVRDEEPGVGRFNPNLVYTGYTFYTPVLNQYPLRLIDLNGESGA